MKFLTKYRGYLLLLVITGIMVALYYYMKEDETVVIDETGTASVTEGDTKARYMQKMY